MDVETYTWTLSNGMYQLFTKSLVLQKDKGIGLTIKNGKVTIAQGNEVPYKITCVDGPATLPVFLATMAYMYCSKVNGGKVLYPKNNKGQDIPLHSKVVNINTPKDDKLSSLNKKSILWGDNKEAVEEQMAFRLGSIENITVPVSDINAINSEL
jgi:hypothetical protein